MKVMARTVKKVIKKDSERCEYCDETEKEEDEANK